MNLFDILLLELWEKIFINLNFESMLNASLVCKDWYQIIGKSKNCMSKIILRNPVCSIEDIDSVLKSDRRYQYAKLLNKRNKQGRNIKNMSSIIDKFSETVTQLLLSKDLKITNELPNLVFLEFNEPHVCNLIVADGLVSKAKNLKTLFVKATHVDAKSIKYLKKSLSENDSLVWLLFGDYRLVNELSAFEAKYRLEKLNAATGSNYGYKQWSQLNMEGLINAHKSSLTHIDGPLKFKDVVNVMSNFPKVEHLIIRYDWRDCVPETELLDFQLNYSLETLVIDAMDFYFRCETFYLNINSIIPKMMNLKKLVISCINDRVLDVICKCKSLKIVRFLTIYPLDASYTRFDQIQKDFNIQIIQSTLETISQ
jgi:hypothetical protein